MKRFQSIVLAAIAVMFAAAYVVPSVPVAAQSSAALSIVPKKKYTIEAGKTVNDKLTIRNLDNEKELNLTLRVVDFTYRDDSGTPKLLLKEDEPTKTWSLKPFLTVPKQVKVEAGKSKTIDMSIKVPKGHGAGSYYSAIVYSSGAPDGGNVGLNASGVTLAFVNIPGKVNENLKVEDFGAYGTVGKDRTPSYLNFTATEPRLMAYTLKNDGNVTEAPVGSISIKSMWGQEYTIDNVNPNESLALIGQSRTFTSCIKLETEEIKMNGNTSEVKKCSSAGLWPGYYSASLNLFYGQNGNSTKELNEAGSFWYLPVWFIILVLIVLVLVGIGIWLLVRKIRNGGTSKKRSRRS